MLNQTEILFLSSKPVLGRESGKWTIQLTWRIAAADGAFVGFGEDEVLTSYRSELVGTFGASATLTLLLLAGITFSARYERER